MRGRTILLWSFPDEIASLARVVGIKEIPSLILLISSYDRSADLEGRVMASRNAVFKDKALRERLSDRPIDSK
jgi:hypothetical protein